MLREKYTRVFNPATCANFLNYIDIFGDQGGEFHRTVTMMNQPNNAIKIEVITEGVFYLYRRLTRVETYYSSANNSIFTRLL